VVGKNNGIAFFVVSNLFDFYGKNDHYYSDWLLSFGCGQQLVVFAERESTG
jgi:hypothetical protein